jgi:hypothetical protein
VTRERRTYFNTNLDLHKHPRPAKEKFSSSGTLPTLCLCLGQLLISQYVPYFSTSTLFEINTLNTLSQVAKMATLAILVTLTLDLVVWYLSALPRNYKNARKVGLPIYFCPFSLHTPVWLGIAGVWLLFHGSCLT